MQLRHKNRLIYFQEQSECTRKYVIPYIEQVLPVTPNLRILEIGCGEGGNLKPFLQLGCQCVGVDIDVAQLEKAKQYLSDYSHEEKLTLIARDIYTVTPDEIGTFDIIMLRDVIEHIPNQERFMHYLKDFMHGESIVFFGFPFGAIPLVDISRYAVTNCLRICRGYTYSQMRCIRRCCIGAKRNLVQSKDYWRLRLLASVCIDLKRYYPRNNIKCFATRII